MQTEELKEAIEQPVTEPQVDSKESKSKRGGKRPGAGRKPNPTKLLRGASGETLAGVANVDIAAVVASLLRSKKEIIRLQALNFVYDRMLGKSKQDVSVSGGLVHAHTRDPFLANLPQKALEELARAYDAVIIKHAPNALPDALQNQTESNRAIVEAEVLSEGEEVGK